MPQNDLLTRLSRLLPSQFEEVLFRTNVPTEHLTGTQAMRAIAAIRLLEQQDRLETLTQVLDAIATAPAGPAGVTVQGEPTKGSDRSKTEQPVDTERQLDPRPTDMPLDPRRESPGSTVDKPRWTPGRRTAVAVLILAIASFCGIGAAAWIGSSGHSEAPNMVRFKGANFRMGLYAAGAPPEECRQVPGEQDCGQWRHPESVDVTHIAAFDLDEKEVTNDDFRDWLNRTTNDWLAPAADGVVMDRRDGLPLVRTKECGDGLLIAPGPRAATKPGSAHRPVACVTWYAADKYCRAIGKRLPLEAEWELAARGVHGRPFPWGTATPRDNAVACNQDAPQDVGTASQDRSPEGVYDLAGNVSEWVASGRDTAEQRSVRGGYFKSHGSCDLLGTRCARVNWLTFDGNIGFRCAQSAGHP